MTLKALSALLFIPTIFAGEFRAPEELLRRSPPPGEGFKTRFFGREVVVPGYDRRKLNAWMAGISFNFPEPASRTVEPAAALYFWRHPSDRKLFYGQISGLFNQLFFAKKPWEGKPWEWVTTFESFTIPFEIEELADGHPDRKERLAWGYVRPGLGIGYRKQTPPGFNDNMAALDLIVEPGWLYFGRYNKHERFVKPRDTFELRTRLKFQWDAFRRNLLNLVTEGVAFGAEGIWGWRTRWRDWGVDGRHPGNNRYYLFRGYAMAATGIPLLGETDRHRLIGRVDAGIGHNLDRFNRGATDRLSGGINPVGEEWSSQPFPILPGATYLEFYPTRYAIAYGEYRFAPTFFSFLHAYGGVAYLNPRKQIHRSSDRREEIMPFAGARITTGFFGSTRLVIDYAHNFGVERKENGPGSNQITVWISGQF